jgi:hypothetical protein
VGAPPRTRELIAVKKAIVVSAIGTQYAALYSKVAPTFEHYAAKHHWDLKVLSELPGWFSEQYSRPTWDFRLLCCAYRLHQPSLFLDYDLLAIMDPDMVINPNAPCLSSYYDSIPAKGIAAVQDVSFSERQLFTSWMKYHYSDFLEDHEVAKLPFPEIHINTGLMLVKPSEVRDELSELNNTDSALSDEDRVNLCFTQTGRTLLLPSKWNVIYPYELVRRGWDHTTMSLSRFRVARRVQREWNMRITQQKMIVKILPDVHVLHFASTDKRIPMHLDIGKLLSAR